MENLGVSGGVNLFQAAAIAGAVRVEGSPQQAVRPDRVASLKENAETSVPPKNVEEARVEAIRTAAEYSAVSFYPISDVRFTIYKELSAGESIYVTRFTSLKDGRVTVVPERTLLFNAGKDAGTLLEALA